MRPNVHLVRVEVLIIGFCRIKTNLSVKHNPWCDLVHLLPAPHVFQKLKQSDASFSAYALRTVGIARISEKKKHERKNKTNFNGFCAVAWIYPTSAAKLSIQFYLAAILFMIRRQIHGVNRLSIYYITVCGVRFGVQSKRSKLDYLIGCKHGTNGNEANRKLMRFDDHPSHPAQMSAPSSNEC